MFIAPLLVAVLGLLCVGAAGFELNRMIAANEAERFDYAVRDRLNAIRDHIEKHTALLRGTAAFLAGSEHVSRSEFATYVSRLRLRDLYPGVQGLGFTRRVAASDLDAFLVFARGENGPGFRIWPEEPRSEYHSIVYLEPQDSRNAAAIGYDMSTEPTRRAAMELARDTGRHAVSGRVELVQEIDQNKQPGFLIYLPVYEGRVIPDTLEARLTRLQGFAYSPYRAGDLFDIVFNDKDQDLDLEVYSGDPSPQNLLYRSRRDADPERQPAFSIVRPLELSGTTWSIRLASNAVFEHGSGRELIPFVVGGGLLATLLLSGLAWSQARATRDAIAAREEVQRLNASLEHRVADAIKSEQERANALRQVEEHLRQSQKMEAVGQLTGGVAHDFNNLLTIIRSSVDFLRRPHLPDQRRNRYIDAISDTVDRASKLTGQLLAFARGQALKPEVFDVPGRIRAIGDMLRTIVGARIQILMEIACDRCFVEADVTQFETALVNMVVNARDAMNGEGALTIRVDSLSNIPPIRGHGGGTGRFVAVSIRDTGSGIPDEQLQHIFEPFFTTKEVGKGTGLGLSQVYGFAKQSGGNVAVESEVGAGTTFTLYLPRIERETENDPGEGERTMGATEEAQECRVLLVEDNVEVGRFSQQLLQDLGYETTWAQNGAEALKLLDEDASRFDVVFSDVVMPGMSGVELGREIRQRHPGLPVVLTSGYSHVLAEEGRHGFELLHKPYAADEVSRLLRRMARRRNAS